MRPVNNLQKKITSEDYLKEFGQLIESISNWLENNGFLDRKIRERIDQVETRLSRQKRNVVLIAECSAGKSDLINSTLFGASGYPLLPSTPGQSTRCTTVLQHEEGEPAGIHLLPTLVPNEALQQSISAIEHHQELWEHIPFDADDREHVTKAMQLTLETELVSPEYAAVLGYNNWEQDILLKKIDTVDGKILIPKYRHAVINIPHILLKQGIRIIDTPGLSAPGVESDMVLHSLESAHAAVFVLSCERGLTPSEMNVWTSHVRNYPSENVLVVMNKIDLLWDGRKSEEELNREIENRANGIARLLDFPVEQVFPVSAQSALKARTEHDHALESASGIHQFELALEDTVSRSSLRNILGNTSFGISSILQVVQDILRQRHDITSTQIEDLKKHTHDQLLASDINLRKIRKEREQMKQATELMTRFHKGLKEDHDRFLAQLDLSNLDRLIARYHLEANNQLTTTGLQQDMQDFQYQAITQFQSALTHITSLETRLGELYRKIENILNVSGLFIRNMHMDVYLDTLQKLSTPLTGYSAKKPLTRQHASVLIKIRNVYLQATDDISIWVRNALVPLERELKEKGSQIEKRLENLKRVRTQDSELADEIKVLKSRLKAHQQRNNTVTYFITRLDEIIRDSRSDINNIADLHNLGGISRKI